MAVKPDAALLALLRARATVMEVARAYFREHGFIEVDTPALVPSPGLDLHLRAFEVRDSSGARVGWLSTSPEPQMKRLLAAGAPRIYHLCRSYRAEEHGSHHEREFSMLEWYRSDAGSAEVMADTEHLVHRVARAVASPRADTLAPPWSRKTVDQAFREHTGHGPDSSDEDAFFRVWAERVQPCLGAERPVFVTDWPASMASMARLNENGSADRFEAFVQGVELCNGFGELTDAVEQRRRLELDQQRRRHAGLPVYPIDERFLAALEDGMPESGGNALGIDRLIMVLLGAASIQATMPFPEETL